MKSNTFSKEDYLYKTSRENVPAPALLYAGKSNFSRSIYFVTVSWKLGDYASVTSGHNLCPVVPLSTATAYHSGQQGYSGWCRFNYIGVIDQL